jgi:hypothetical protein
MTSVRKRLDTWFQRLTAIFVAGCVLMFLINNGFINNGFLGDARFFLAMAGFAATALACFAAGVVVHELGHFACAVVGSIPVYRVVIGDGPVLWRRRIRDIWFEVRRWPLSGRVEPYGVMDYRWYWWALFLLGGALGNLVIVGVVAALWAAGVTGYVLDFLLFAQVLLIVMTIIPMASGQTGGNDGMLLVRLLSRPACDSAALRAGYEARIAGRSPGQTPPPMTAASVRLLHHTWRLWADGIPRAEVRDDLVHELKRGDLSPAERSWVLDTLVTEAITSSDPAARPHLDAWSLEALALGPDQPTLQGSRGAALVELGRPAEGKPLLARLAGPDRAASYDSFMCRVFHALAEHRLGDGAAARQLADAARATAEAAGINAPVLLARLDREIPRVDGGGAL